MSSATVVTHHGAATSSGINWTWAPKRGCSSAGPWAQGCLAEGGGDRVLGCRRCVLIENLCHKVEELQKEVYRLNSIRYKKTSLMRASPSPCSCKSLNSNCMKGGAGRGIDFRDPHNSDGCKLLTLGIRKMASALPSGLQNLGLLSLSPSSTRGNQCTQTEEIQFKHKKNPFHCGQGSQTLEQDAQKVCGVSIPGDISKCTWTWSWGTCSCWSGFEQGFVVDDLQTPLPTSAILFFFDVVEGHEDISKQDKLICGEWYIMSFWCPD